MIFTVFHKTGEIHFDHDGFDDYDGDEGYDVDYEISNNECLEVITQTMAAELYHPARESAEYVAAKSMALAIIQEMGLEDKVFEYYAEFLQDYAQEQYDNEN